MKTIEATATSPGSRDAVWEQLADASKWSQWGSWSHVEIEGGGPQQPGAVRVLVQKPFRVRERVTDWVPGERMGYELIDGMNVQGYRATVTLEGTDSGGTTVRWSSAYERAGLLTGLILRFAVRDACKRVAKAAGSAR